MKTKKSEKKLGNQKESWYVFSICILGIMLIASLSLFLSNPFTTNLPASSGLKPIGEYINISVEENGSNSQSVFFYGSLLPNYNATQEVNVTLKANQENAVARAKVFMYDKDGKIISLSATSTSDWELKTDGYYYYKNTLTANLTVQFLKSVQIPGPEIYLNSSNIYSIIFSVETLPSTSNYLEIWKIN